MNNIPPKPRGSQRAVQSRVAGSTPDLGRLSRISGRTETHKTRKRSKRRGKEPTGTNSGDGAVLRRWLVLGLIGGGTVFCCMLMWSLLRPTNASPQPSAGTTGVDGTHTAGGATVQPLTTEEALRKTRQLVNAGSQSDLRGLLRPGVISPAEAIAFMHDLSVDQGQPKAPRWIGSFDSLSLPVEMVILPYPEGEGRIVSFTPNSEGVWQLDFDAFAALSQPSIDYLIDGKSDQGRVRVIVSRDHYYNELYSDDDQWACFAMRSTESDRILYGYCSHDSDVMTALIAVESKAREETGTADKPSAKKRFPVILDIKHSPNSDANQFEIKRVISDSWLKPDVPFDELVRARNAP